VRYSKAEDYCIYTSAKWSCKKDEQDIDGKSKVHAQWCRVRARILPEAVGIACYLVNRSPSSVLGDKTPQEVWTSKEPSLTHLKVFGYDAYVHVPKENRSKLDKKAEKCIFIGYKDGLKGYMLWNTETKKVAYSRDLVFREMKDVVKQEFLPSKEEPEKIEFDLKDDEADSTKEHESEEEDPHTPVLRRSNRERRLTKRYSPYYFHSNFSLSITDDYSWNCQGGSGFKGWKSMEKGHGRRNGIF
jgi:hypothetical protein